MHVGYHYHAATDCLLAMGQANQHGTVIGVAMDGRSIYARSTSSNDVPTDLDACGGHVVNGSDYHYYAGEQGSNAILSCMTAEVGCVSERRGEVCDASGLFGKFGNTLSSPQ